MCSFIFNRQLFSFSCYVLYIDQIEPSTSPPGQPPGNRQQSFPGAGNFTLGSALGSGIWPAILSQGPGIWPTAISKVQIPGGCPERGACWSFKLIDTLLLVFENFVLSILLCFLSLLNMIESIHCISSFKNVTVCCTRQLADLSDFDWQMQRVNQFFPSTGGRRNRKSLVFGQAVFLTSSQSFLSDKTASYAGYYIRASYIVFLFVKSDNNNRKQRNKTCFQILHSSVKTSAKFVWILER